MKGTGSEPVFWCPNRQAYRAGTLRIPFAHSSGRGQSERFQLFRRASSADTEAACTQPQVGDGQETH